MSLFLLLLLYAHCTKLFFWRFSNRFRETGKDSNQQSVFMNPSVFNMDKVREANLLSANGHMTSYGISKFYDGLFGGLLSPQSKDAIVDSVSPDSSKKANDALENNSFGGKHGLGFQVYSFVNLETGEPVPVIGHLGFGGFIGMTIPSEKVSVGITTNTLSFDKDSAPGALVKEIALHFGLKPQM